MFPPPKKVQKKNIFLKTFIFLESFFLDDFCLDKFKKIEDTRKNQTEKEKREKHNKRKKLKGQLENRKEFLLSKKMEQKSRGNKRGFVFFKKIFSNDIFFKKTFER